MAERELLLTATQNNLAKQDHPATMDLTATATNPRKCQLVCTQTAARARISSTSAPPSP